MMSINLMELDMALNKLKIQQKMNAPDPYILNIQLNAAKISGWMLIEVIEAEWHIYAWVN